MCMSRRALAVICFFCFVCFIPCRFVFSPSRFLKIYLGADFALRMDKREEGGKGWIWRTNWFTSESETMIKNEQTR